MHEQDCPLRTVPWTNDELIERLMQKCYCDPSLIAHESCCPSCNPPGDTVHLFIVRVTATSYGLAKDVMSNRLGPDEDYGYPYTIDWKQAP